jgi:enamine deaminase RidA (YjgF/YER057c/UK114 family)
MSTRTLFPATTAWADIVGYSRAVRVGDHAYVSGTVAVEPGRGVVAPGDCYEQSRHALGTIQSALEGVGMGLKDVVRTRVFLTRAEDWEACGRAHHEFFGDVMPASSTLVIKALLDDELVVEIEADAVAA